jgi:ATP-dependent helicase YprA (DUF1998 family)
MADADPVCHVPANHVSGPLRTAELIRDRTVQAVLSQSGINHPALAAEIRRRFGSTDVDAGALVREPVIEGAAPFVSSGRTFADCAGAPLHPEVIRAIASEQAGDYRFAGEAQPYRHQIEAWEHLTAPERRSVLVSSGTGSGKTECFLMPLLSDLAGEAERTGKLSGVRALMLYPLNALIASQEERLRAWCAPFGNRMRFGLYNGLTPEKANRHLIPAPEQVRDRETLRRDPPPILVTNVTMLEYMTVRRVDRTLIENSRGTLRWIILDEAHGYVGSAAAEIALLIRRVLLTFGVRAEDVRFVATSATIGDPLGGKDVTDELRRFLRDLSGANEERVKVVLGAREQVILPPPVTSQLLTSALLKDRDAVAANPAVQAFVRTAETRPMTLAEVRALLAPTGVPTEEAVGAVAADGDAQRGPLLPLRVHSFLRAVPGLWSCLNHDCGDAPAGWAFGAISAERIDGCATCRSPVFEVKLCLECGEPYLECEERDGHLHAVTTPLEADEFAVNAPEAAEDLDGDGEQGDDDCTSQQVYDAKKLAISSRSLPGWSMVPVDPTTGRRPDQTEPGMRTMSVHLFDSCGACGASARDGSILRAFRYGAPFLIGNAAPVLLEGLPPRAAEPAAPYRPPVDGRQLLSFTDSRQGTARFAANLQTTAERNFVRGFVYHAVQGSMVAASTDDGAIAGLRAEIAQLEALSAPTLAELIAGKKNALAKATTPSEEGLWWPELRRSLAALPEIHYWMTKVWALRDDRFSKSAEVFAEFLLLREFNRRPRRGNTAETMGVARLRFDAIDRATNVPEPLVARGFGVADWRGLLSSIVDMTVRGRFAIRASWDDLHWLHTQKPMTKLLPPGETPQSTHETAWPMVSAKPGTPSNLVLIMEKALGLDRSDPHDRARMNEVLDAAWQQLMPLLSSRSQPGYALDFADARIAPVTQAWLCPVSKRVLPATALGRTQYGHRERLRTADVLPQPLVLPRLPVTFPRASELETIRSWLTCDDQVQALRGLGVWSNLHDRVALLSPYLRAAEHSAQQPPARLREFEAAFKRGEINILNCSTTMEMGVDIGSVSAVMMTNVPPALANYRQRVGRAGRRRQGYASSLTYTRSTPLDREAFREPLVYLARQTRVPQVRLDSRRIVQRHVNALLLARWFAGAGGEAMKTRVGDFFGCPPALGAQADPNAPIDACLAWLDKPSTQDALCSELAALTRGTALAGNRKMFEATTGALTAARDAVVREWEALQQQAEGAPPEGRKSVQYQLERLALDNLLKELAQRGVLPGHGFPTGVVPFVNADTPAADERAADDDSSRRRRSFPTRTLDIAIRDYAPGAEVVVDGLVYRSAGVTLNWQRPADDVAAREVQNIKLFWTCSACGAADTAHSAPQHCPSCHADVPPGAQRRFLEPAGFTADMRAKPHADTDEVTYVEPERERIVVRGAAWGPMADPAQGRMRASHEGLVFYSSRGPSKQGYHVCLECGRAEPVGSSDAPLAGHQPLRFTKKDDSGLCPGNSKPFKITRAIALGYESVTDVVEIQPVGLESEGVAWAVISALREALVRRLGVEPGELGMAVRAAFTPLGQRTHSLFLYDRASGGAGFAPQAAGQYESLLADASTVLDCHQPGCTRGCSACVLTADLHKQQETIDRIGALAWARAASTALASVADVDRAAPDAQLARAVADEIAAAIDRGLRAVTIWPSADSDVAALMEGSFPMLARHIGDHGARVTLVVDPAWLASLDAAARLALRDAAVSLALDLRQGTAPTFANGARAVAATGAESATLWASRDQAAATLGAGWGQGASAPVVRITAGKPVLAAAVRLDMLLPESGTRFLELRAEVDGTIVGFGERLAAKLLPAIRAAGGTGRLERISYADRYLQSPLVVRLVTEALAALRDKLAAPDMALPLAIVTNPFRPNDRQPFAPDHDWQWEDDRRDVMLALLGTRGFSVDMDERGAPHGRTITLAFTGGATVRVVLDQGFGPWRTPRYAKFDFGDAVDRQITKITAFSALIEARGASYVVVTG